MFFVIEKMASLCYLLITMFMVPCKGSIAVDFRRHEFASRSSVNTGEKGPPAGPPPGSPAWIKANPPPPLCMADDKLSVYVGRDNLRTFTTIGGYHSDEALRNKVRCKGALPSEKCLPFELRKSGKSDADSAPALGLYVNRKSGSFRSIMMDAVEGPIPLNQVPTEATISGFGGGYHNDFAAQPPDPANKPFEIKGVKPPALKPVDDIKDFSPEVVSPKTAQNTPTHPASQSVQKPSKAPPSRASGGALSPKALHSSVEGPPATPANTDFTHHMSTPCSGVSHKTCPCVPDSDLPLMWKPSQSIVQKIEQVTLAAPERKNRDLKKEPLHILVLGAGSGALSMSVLNNCRVFVPGGLKVESVEPDQSVMTVSQQLFGFKDIPGVHKIEVSSCSLAVDGRTKFVEEQAKYGNAAKYDVVVINVFNGDDTVPTQCRNATFLGQVRKIVKDQGVVLQSINKKELDGTLTDYTTVFGHRVRGDPVSMGEGPGSYHVIVAGDLELVKSGTTKSWPCFIGFVAVVAAFVSF